MKRHTTFAFVSNRRVSCFRAASPSAVMEPAQTADELEELRAYNEAMEMNRQLKEMLEQSEAPPQQQSRAPLRQHQPQARTRAPAQARKRAAAPAAAAAAAAGGRNFTFSDQKLNTMGRENQVLLERMQRIALSSGTGLSSKPAAASYRQKVGSNGINRQKKDRKVQSENMVRAFVGTACCIRRAPPPPPQCAR